MPNHKRLSRTGLVRRDAHRAAVPRAELGAKVLEAAPVPILLVDVNGTIQYANPFFERLSGYALDEIQGGDWFTIFVPAPQRDRRRAVFEQRFKCDFADGDVGSIVTRAGAERDIEWTFDLLRDAEGRATTMLALGRDVTERIAAQEALRASEQRFADAHRIANIGAWQLDLRTWKRWWSDELHRIAGVQVGTELTQDVFLSLIHPEDRERFAESFAAALRDGASEIEGRMVRPDGEVRDLYARARTTYDGTGRPVLMAGTTQDITERKRTQEAARRASELLSSVVAGAPIVLFELDREGRFRVSEGRALDKLGLRPGEMVGASALEVYGGLPGFMDAFQAALAGQQRVLCSSVGESDFEVVYVPSLDGRGRIDGVIGVAFDVTERNRVAAELRASVVAQQELVAELRDNDRRKNDFIAMLSHELRNPLSAIRSGLCVLDRASPGSDPARRAAGIIDRQVTQLARLVDDLLDVSRITQDKIRLQRAPVDVAELVRVAVDDHQAMFAGQGVRLEVTLAGAPVIVHGDAARLTQVIGNLLHNAAKFTATGGVTRVSLACDPDARSAVLRVADTGAGIDPGMIERLFEPFTQSDRTLARSLGGLGLGLTLVKGLVQLHGGEVSVRSEGAGKGAEFVVRLPLAAADAAARAARERSGGRCDARRVLVIEDNFDAAEMLASLVELEGHVASTAHDGAAGMRIARELHPDLVLCDLGLPGISGYDVARELRSDASLDSVLLVALSGYAAAEDVAKARAAGFDLHLAKPVALDRLRAVLDSLRDARCAGLGMLSQSQPSRSGPGCKLS